MVNRNFLGAVSQLKLTAYYTDAGISTYKCAAHVKTLLS
jgi:hypothetical protein